MRHRPVEPCSGTDLTKRTTIRPVSQSLKDEFGFALGGLCLAIQPLMSEIMPPPQLLISPLTGGDFCCLPPSNLDARTITGGLGMKNLKTRFNAFATSDAVRYERFKWLLSRSGSEKVFSEKFFDAVEKRCDAITKLQIQLFWLQVPIFVYLVLIVTGTDTNVSFLGITAGKNLREVLVVTSALLALWVTWLNNEKDGLKSMLKARNYRLAKGNVSYLEYLNAGHGIVPLTAVSPIEAHLTRTPAQLFALTGMAIIAIILFLMAIVFGYCVHILALIEIYRHPNFSTTATFGVISFVLLADFLAIFWHLSISGVLPYESTERLMRYAKLSEANPEKASAILKQAAESYFKQGRLKRFLTRPKLPKDF